MQDCILATKQNWIDLDRSPKLHKRMHLSKSNTPARFVHFIICKLYIKKKTVNKQMKPESLAFYLLASHSLDRKFYAVRHHTFDISRVKLNDYKSLQLSQLLYILLRERKLQSE